MEEKDDFDSFIEEAEEIIRLYEQGFDVNEKADILRKRAELVNPLDVPSTSDPILISNLVADCTKIESRSIFKSVPRQRHNTRSRNSDENSNKNLITDSQSPESQTNHSYSILRVSIFIMIFLLLCFIYYMQLPTPCRRPIW